MKSVLVGWIIYFLLRLSNALRCGKNLRMTFLCWCFRFTSVVRKPSVLALLLVTSLWPATTKASPAIEFSVSPSVKENRLPWVNRWRGIRNGTFGDILPHTPSVVYFGYNTISPPVLSHWQPSLHFHFFMMRELTPNPAVLPGNPSLIHHLPEGSLLFVELFSFPLRWARLGS